MSSPFEFLNGGSEHFIKTEAKNIDGIKYFLSGFNINIPIMSGKCESDVFVSSGTAYVKDETEQSDKKIAAAILRRLSETDYIKMMD